MKTFHARINILLELLLFNRAPKAALLCIWFTAFFLGAAFLHLLFLHRFLRVCIGSCYFFNTTFIRRLFHRCACIATNVFSFIRSCAFGSDNFACWFVTNRSPGWSVERTPFLYAIRSGYGSFCARWLFDQGGISGRIFYFFHRMNAIRFIYDKGGSRSVMYNTRVINMMMHVMICSPPGGIIAEIEDWPVWPVRSSVHQHDDWPGVDMHARRCHIIIRAVNIFIPANLHIVLVFICSLHLDGGYILKFVLA